MPSDISVYFDFTSPFSYLALARLPALAARYGRAIDYRVIDLKAAKQLAGNVGPSTRDIPLKLGYARVDQKRWAKRYGIPIVTPRGYDSSRVNRGTFFAARQGATRDYVNFIFHRIWGEGGKMDDTDMLHDVAQRLGWDPVAFLAFVESPEPERLLSDATVAAHRLGVFGVPTIMIDEEMWWGNDRIDFVEEYLAARAESDAKSPAQHTG